MPVLLVGLSHHTSPVELRERFAFADAAIPETLARLKSLGLAEEAVILSTCNRVELYAAKSRVDGGELEALREFLVGCGRHAGVLGAELYLRGEPQSVEHLFKVASGLDSMVLGETEILGQVKKAYDLALQHRHTGPVLNRTFQRAFNVAKHIRTETQIQRGNVSVASVAVDLAEKIFDDLADRVVMVIGAGDMSEKTAKALLGRGVRQVVVTNRTRERAEALAVELGGRAVAFDAWDTEFDRVDILISSTASPHYVIDRARLDPLLRLRKYRPLLLIDIAVPRDVDPTVNYLENVYLYNIDDLQAIADDSLKRRRDELARCDSIIRERVAALLADAHRHPLVSSPQTPAYPTAG